MYPLKPDTITLGMLVAITICCTVIIVSFRRLSPSCLLLADLLNTTSRKARIVEIIQSVTHTAVSCSAHTFLFMGLGRQAA